MSSELSRSSSPRWIAAALALVLAIVVATLAPSCVGPDAFNRDAGPIQTGLGGNDGIAGQTGSGGSGLGGAAMGGHTGAGGSGVGGATGGVGGKTGAGGSGLQAAAPEAEGAGRAAAGRRRGRASAARGTGGAIGTGGALANDAGNDGDDAGAGGATGMGGAGGARSSSATTSSRTPSVCRRCGPAFGGSAGDFAVGGRQDPGTGPEQATARRSAPSTRAVRRDAPWSGPTT